MRWLPTSRTCAQPTNAKIQWIKRGWPAGTATESGSATPSTFISEGSTSIRMSWLPTRNPEAACVLMILQLRAHLILLGVRQLRLPLQVSRR